MLVSASPQAGPTAAISQTSFQQPTISAALSAIKSTV